MLRSEGEKKYLALKTIQTGRFLQSLDVGDGQTDEEVHQHDHDGQQEGEEDKFSGTRIGEVGVAIEVVDVLELTGHHHHGG